MASLNMLTYTVKLDQQPGGVSPEIHLKQGISSVKINLQVSPRDYITDAGNKASVVKAVLPDGTSFFAAINMGLVHGELTATLFPNDVCRMVSAAGQYRATLTILDTEQATTRKDYMNRDFQTVLSFTVIVHKAAYEKEED